MDLIHYDSRYSNQNDEFEYDDELMHYGVKGMHWGIRRYQPYPDGKEGTFIGKKQAEKLVKNINKNEKTRAQRAWYANRSKSVADKYRLKSESAKSQKKMAKYKKKADKQMVDYETHAKSIEEIDQMREAAIDAMKKSGIDISSKKTGQYVSGSGNPLHRGIMITRGPFNIPGPGDVFVNVERDKYKAKTNQDKEFDEAKKVAENEIIEYMGIKGTKINMDHPVVKYAIDQTLKEYPGDKKSLYEWVKKVGDPLMYDDWASAVMDYNKSKKQNAVKDRHK